MEKSVRNRLISLGVLWGILLAALPAFVMGSSSVGFLIAAFLCAAASGALGTLFVGHRAVVARRRGSERSGVLAALGAGLVQGVVGGGLAAILIWALMAATISGFPLENPTDPSALMRPRVFIGSFFVALSVFLYALAGGLLIGPVFGTLVNRTVRHPANRIPEPEVSQ